MPTEAERRAYKLDALLEAAAAIPEIVNPWALAYVIRAEEQATRARDELEAEARASGPGGTDADVDGGR